MDTPDVHTERNPPSDWLLEPIWVFVFCWFYCISWCMVHKGVCNVYILALDPSPKGGRSCQQNFALNSTAAQSNPENPPISSNLESVDCEGCCFVIPVGIPCSSITIHAKQIWCLFRLHWLMARVCVFLFVGTYNVSGGHHARMPAPCCSEAHLSRHAPCLREGMPCRIRSGNCVSIFN